MWFLGLEFKLLLFESLLERFLGQFFDKLNTNSKISFLQSFQFFSSKNQQSLRDLQSDFHVLIDEVQFIHENGFDMLMGVGFKDNILDIFDAERVSTAVFLDGVDGVADAK